MDGFAVRLMEHLGVALGLLQSALHALLTHPGTGQGSANWRCRVDQEVDESDSSSRLH